jgi:hypothetical protein
MRTPVEIANHWQDSVESEEDLRELIIHCQRDSAYCYAEAAKARDKANAVGAWLAPQIQAAAAHSAEIGRHLMLGEA